MGLVAQDGTKMAARASMARNRSEDAVDAAVQEMFPGAAAADAAEDAVSGRGVVRMSRRRYCGVGPTGGAGSRPPRNASTPRSRSIPFRRGFHVTNWSSKRTVNPSGSLRQTSSRSRPAASSHII
ncbi:MAG: hypothetical protein ACKVZ6_08560 [Kineosporiaceae bacterium]